MLKPYHVSDYHSYFCTMYNVHHVSDHYALTNLCSFLQYTHYVIHPHAYNNVPVYSNTHHFLFTVHHVYPGIQIINTMKLLWYTVFMFIMTKMATVKMYINLAINNHAYILCNIQIIKIFDSWVLLMLYSQKKWLTMSFPLPTVGP